MTEAAAHDKQMENFVGTEIFVFGIEDRQLQRVDDAADGINDAAGQEPAEGRRGQGGYDLPDRSAKKTI